MLVAMNVTDRERYGAYRAAMLPILARYGGGFRYDFVVDEVLSKEPDHPVTRVFAIYFKDEPSSETFFSDADYLAVKRAHYDGAVDGHTVIASYSR